MNYSRELLIAGTPSFLVGCPWAMVLESDSEFMDILSIVQKEKGPLLRGYAATGGVILDFEASAVHLDLEAVVGDYGFDALCVERLQEAKSDVVAFLDSLKAGTCVLSEDMGDHYNVFVSIYTITEYNKVRLNGLTYFATALNCVEFLQVLGSHTLAPNITVKAAPLQNIKFVTVSKLLNQGIDLAPVYKALDILPNKMGAFINLQIKK